MSNSGRRQLVLGQIPSHHWPWNFPEKPRRFENLTQDTRSIVFLLDLIRIVDRSIVFYIIFSYLTSASYTLLYPFNPSKSPWETQVLTAYSSGPSKTRRRHSKLALHPQLRMLDAVWIPMP